MSFVIRKVPVPGPRGDRGPKGEKGEPGVGGADLSDDNPEALQSSASPGVSGAASRKDHKHPLPPEATDTVAGLFAAFSKRQLDGLYALSVVANLYGAEDDDIGAKINAAIAATGPGTAIYVMDGDYSIDTPIELDVGTQLYWGRGTITTTTTAGAILLNDDVAIRGTGVSTIILESTDDSTDNATIIIKDPKTFAAPGFDALGSVNVLIEDLQLQGTAHPLHNNGSTGAITVGNSHQVYIRRVYVKHTSAIGISVGGFSTADNYAEDVWVTDCIFDEVYSQNVGIVNAKNFHVDYNTFKRAGHDPEGPAGAAAYVDLEPNIETDWMENFTITGNIIDGKEGNLGNGIIVQSHPARLATGKLSGPGLVSNNTIIGGDASLGGMSNGIQLSYASSVSVIGNTVEWVGQSALLIGGDHNYIHGNKTRYIAGAGVYAIYIEGKHNTVAANQVFGLVESGDGYRVTDIYEADNADTDYNYFFGNHLDPFFASDTQSDYDPKIIVHGAHSKAFANNLAGYLVGKGNPITVADLRLHPVPHVGSAAIRVDVDGLATRGDGGDGSYKWDDTSTATDNGLSVIKPTNMSVGRDGRWLRVPACLQLTTSDRNALTMTTADKGFEIFNTTTSKKQCWDGSTWNDLW